MTETPSKDTQYKILFGSTILGVTITLLQFLSIDPSTATTIIGLSIGISLSISTIFYFMYILYDTFIDNIIHDQDEDSDSGSRLSPNMLQDTVLDSVNLTVDVDRELLKKEMEYNGYNVSVTATLKHVPYSAIEDKIDLLLNTRELSEEKLREDHYYRIVTVDAVNEEIDQREITVSTALALDSEMKAPSEMDLIDQVDKTTKSVLREIKAIDRHTEQLDSDIEFLLDEVQDDISKTGESEIAQELSEK